MSDDHDHDHEPVHPRERELRGDDPMEITGVEVDGDPAIMLDCLVEEFARMGCDADTIVRMFDDPFYTGPYGLKQFFGPEALRQRIERTLSRCGTMRYRAVECDDEDEAVNDRVELTIRGRQVR